MDYISIGHIRIDLIQCHELFVLFIDYILLKIPIKFEYSFVFPRNGGILFEYLLKVFLF